MSLILIKPCALVFAGFAIQFGVYLLLMEATVSFCTVDTRIFALHRKRRENIIDGGRIVAREEKAWSEIRNKRESKRTCVLC